MSFEDLGNLGEFVAAIATLATLIYLAVQIRQNTDAVRGSTVHMVTQTQQQELQWGNEIADVFTKMIESPTDLDTVERWKMNQWLLSAIAARQNEFFQFRHGHMSDDVWGESQNIIRQILSVPWTRDWWSGVGRPLFAKEFVATVDELLTLEVPELGLDTALTHIKAAGQSAPTAQNG